ncbi:hypothetical protein KIPB_011077, partial [Kipferlia bialata]
SPAIPSLHRVSVSCACAAVLLGCLWTLNHRRKRIPEPKAGMEGEIERRRLRDRERAANGRRELGVHPETAPKGTAKSGRVSPPAAGVEREGGSEAEREGERETEECPICKGAVAGEAAQFYCCPSISMCHECAKEWLTRCHKCPFCRKEATFYQVGSAATEVPDICNTSTPNKDLQPQETVSQTIGDVYTLSQIKDETRAVLRMCQDLMQQSTIEGSFRVIEGVYGMAQQAQGMY